VREIARVWVAASVTLLFVLWPWMDKIWGDDPIWARARWRDRAAFAFVVCALLPVALYLSVLLFAGLWIWALS